MSDYRVFLLDVAGAIVGGLELTRDTDEGAMEAARSMLSQGQRAEVWHLARRVGFVGTAEDATD